MNYSTLYDVIAPAILVRRLSVHHEHRACIVRTMAALRPDVLAMIVAGVCLIRFYGKPWQPRAVTR